MAGVEFGKEGGARDASERHAAELYTQLFETSNDPLADRLVDFAKFIRRQDLTKLLVRYEIFKRILPVKGSIVECGVFRGAGLMTWAKLSAILEPNNLLRRVIGFDSFQGLVGVTSRDTASHRTPQEGELRSDSFDELTQLIQAFDRNRFLGHIPKVSLVRGDACETIPQFVTDNPHLVVSLLYLDFDLYEPTKVALDYLVPRMPIGAVLAFDELDNPAWPGETLAALDSGVLGGLRLERLDFDPYVAFAVR